jgi:hypothetical protein
LLPICECASRPFSALASMSPFLALPVLPSAFLEELAYASSRALPASLLAPASSSWWARASAAWSV